MGDKKQNKTFIMVLIGIIGVCLITIGLTYAYWILTKQQTGENVVNTACLNITFTGENDITLDKAYPMKLEELETFLSKSTPFHFTIENTCDDLANATINLESLNAEAEKQLQDEYIDAILYETDYHTNLNIEKHLNESMYNDENKVISNSLHAYELYNFVLQKRETKSFNLLLYMDPNTPMVDANMNATWKGKITLSAGYKEEPTANLNGLKVPVVESGDGLYAVSHDVSEISEEWNKTEYRYAGANPNNYVSFNNEIWRVIGLVNVKNVENVEQRIKIVRTDGVKEQNNFGNYAWDSINYPYINNWTTSKLKDMLNGIYFESELGECYIGTDNTAYQNTCDFNTGMELPKGFDDTARSLIDNEVIWNIGGWSTSSIIANQFYEKERGINTGNGNTYPAEWSNETDESGKHNGIGLIYPSDFGYAVGGEVRNNCLTKNLSNYKENNCGTNNWLKSNNSLWTLSPNNSESSIFSINSSGFINNGSSTYYAYGIWPTLYLKSSVKITPNPHPEQEYGTIDNPFQLTQSGI